MIAAEDKKIMQPFGDRSGVVIEAMLTDQWYVDAATLAKPAIAATRNGDIRVVPETWKKTWYNWLENIQPWCVSRQLWWGHRIPAWYAEDGTIFVAESEEEARKQAEDGATQQAIKSWQQRAQNAAQGLGFASWRPGRVNVQTSDAGRPYPMMARGESMAMQAAAPPVAVEAGTTDVVVTVSGDAVLDAPRPASR